MQGLQALSRQGSMVLGTGALALFSLIDSPYPELAPLQNLPTLAVLAILWAGLRRWPMSDMSVACLCAFLLLHTIGGRYAYSYVPYDAWLAALGLPGLGESFGFERNHYDRLVHFAFGFLLVNPVSNALSRYSRLSARWATYVAVEFVLAGSASYEIFEWLLTVVMAPDHADTYNGQQGDLWDAQKDMALALGGALLAVALMRLAARRRAAP